MRHIESKSHNHSHCSGDEIGASHNSLLGRSTVQLITIILSVPLTMCSDHHHPQQAYIGSVFNAPS